MIDEIVPKKELVIAALLGLPKSWSSFASGISSWKDTPIFEQMWNAGLVILQPLNKTSLVILMMIVSSDVLMDNWTLSLSHKESFLGFPLVGFALASGLIFVSLVSLFYGYCVLLLYV